jgi:hypothetical protein
VRTNRIVLAVAMAVVSGVLLAGCACPVTPPVVPTAEVMAEEDAAPTGEQEATGEAEQPTGGWQANGAISDGEYAHTTTIGDVALWWYNDAEFLYLAMEAPTTGWVAVGLDPEDRMQGANYLFGAVVAGEAMIWDAYGTAPAGNAHPPDEELGGTNDIVAYAGVEEAGVTRFEVQIPLDSGDEFDKPLEAGNTYPVIAAMGASDSFDTHHLSRGAGSLTLD